MSFRLFCISPSHFKIGDISSYDLVVTKVGPFFNGDMLWKARSSCDSFIVSSIHKKVRWLLLW